MSSYHQETRLDACSRTIVNSCVNADQWPCSLAALQRISIVTGITRPHRTAGHDRQVPAHLVMRVMVPGCRMIRVLIVHSAVNSEGREGDKVSDTNTSQRRSPCRLPLRLRCLLLCAKQRLLSSEVQLSPRFSRLPRLWRSLSLSCGIKHVTRRPAHLTTASARQRRGWDL